MGSVRRAVQDCRANATDSEELIANLSNLAEIHGSVAYQAIFQIFAGLEVSCEKAENYWQKLLFHRTAMVQKLGRNIDLLPSIYDFLATSDHPLNNPRMIEESSYAKVIKETTHDSLTSLYNRQYFDQVLEQSISSATRYNTDVSLLFLDIDNFKDINDTYGHGFGDLTLQRIAKVIESEKRDSDIAARYGGEEFVLLMPHTECINALILAERIRLKIKSLVFSTDQNDFSVTISGGLASFPQNAKNSIELLHRADSALYLAKGAGKNNISTFKEEKRRYLRVKYEEPVKVKMLGFDSTPIFSGTSKDICIGGILFENDQHIAIGSRIQVSMPIKKDSPILLIGTVVRVEAYGENQFDIGMTISFKEMEKIAQNEISNFLKSNAS